MKIPSLETVIDTFKLTINRYRYTICIALIGWMATWFVIGFNNYSETIQEIFESVALMCVIALPLSIGFKFAFKALNVRKVNQYAVSGLFLALLVYFGFTYDRSIDFFNSFYSFAIAANIFAGLAMHSKTPDNDSFWRFNKTMLIRLVISGLFAVVLGTGLSVAIGALQVLFKVDIQGEAYARLWSTMGWLFTTYIFLAGINPDIEAYQEHEDYPKLLKVFSQFVLIPLSMLYLVILYAYELKILFQMELPNGFVSGLIFAMAAVGILATLLLYPIREYNNYIKQYSKWLFYSIIPLIPLLFIALSTRIGEYGITEARYYGYVVACWLVGIMGYYIISKKKNIRAIPITLAIIAVVLPLGPWSASNVSTKSQVNRFIELNSEYSKAATDSVRKEKIVQMNSIFRYIEMKKDLSVLVTGLKENGMLKTEIKQSLDSLSFRELSSNLSLDSVITYQYIGKETKNTDNDFTYFFQKENHDIINIVDYQYYAYYYLDNDSKFAPKIKVLDNNLIKASIGSGLGINLTIDSTYINVQLKNYIENWKIINKQRSLSIQDMTIPLETSTFKAVMIVELIGGGIRNGEYEIDNVQFSIMWTKK